MSSTLPEITNAPISDDVNVEKKQTDVTVNELGLSDQRIEAARQDALRQANMSLKEALSSYRSAAMWASLMTLTVVMEAYDYGLMGSLFGFPAFAQKFGTKLPSGKYNISAAQQSVLKQITKAGQLVGLALTGPALDRFGYKWTQLGALVLIIPMVFIQFFAPNIGTLIAGQFLLGIPLAPFLTLSNVYGAEIAPVTLQTYFTSVTSLGWTLGGFISTGVLRGLLNSSIKQSYRIAFAVQWCWIPPLALIIFLAPESPTWCVKTGRTERARAALKRLGRKDETDEQIDNRLALIEYTNELEKHYAQSTSWLECFKGVNLRRTEIALVVYSSMNLDGYDIGAATSYFFQQAGMNPTQSFDLSLGNSAIALVTCLICWAVITRAGRRPLYVFALAATVLIMLAIGGLGIPKPNVQLAWATGGVCYLFNVIFHICQGPLTYSYVAEIPSTRLRAKTVAIARMGFLFTAVFMVVLVNYQINATAWNWRGKAGFFWAPITLIMTVWAYYRLPETKDRSPAELDKLFMEKVPARKFRTTHVDVVDESTIQEGA